MKNRGVTAIVTSCGRQDLLEKTISSFIEKNTFPLEDFIVIEDGPGKYNNDLAKKFKSVPIKWMETGRWRGQIQAIDLAYANIHSHYIFHFEDDWEFLESGFIEKSIMILDADPRCLQVQIRALDDLNGHPLASSTEHVGSIPFRRLLPNFQSGSYGTRPLVWHGFSFNPGVRRLDDYRALGNFAAHTNSRRGGATSGEADIGAIYHAMNFYVAVLADNNGRGYVRHLGGLRHINAPLHSRLLDFMKRTLSVRPE